MLVKILLSIGLLAVPYAAAVPLDATPETSTKPVDASTEAIDSTHASVEVTSATTAIASTTDAQTWTLRYKFLPGQQLRYKNTEGITLDAMQGEIRKVDVTSFEQRRVFTVSSVDDAGAAKLTMQYEFVRMQRHTNDLAPVTFDTKMEAKDVPPEFKNTARDLKGSAPRFWISSLGAALQESNSGEGYQQAEKPVAQAGNVIVDNKSAYETDGGVKQAVAESATNTSPITNDVAETEETNIKKLIKAKSDSAITFLMPLPEHAVAIHETWREVIPVNVRVTEEISRKINILRTFRLESVKDGIATISFRSSVEAAVKSPTMRAQLIKATPRGTLTIDIERGVMLKREIRYDETVLNAIGQNSVVLCNGSSTEVLMDSAD